MKICGRILPALLGIVHDAGGRLGWFVPAILQITCKFWMGLGFTACSNAIICEFERNLFRIAGLHVGTATLQANPARIAPSEFSDSQ